MESSFFAQPTPPPGYIWVTESDLVNIQTKEQLATTIAKAHHEDNKSNEAQQATFQSRHTQGKSDTNGNASSSRSCGLYYMPSLVKLVPNVASNDTVVKPSVLSSPSTLLTDYVQETPSAVSAASSALSFQTHMNTVLSLKHYTISPTTGTTTASSSHQTSASYSISPLHISGQFVSDYVSSTSNNDNSSEKSRDTPTYPSNSIPPGTVLWEEAPVAIYPDQYDVSSFMSAYPSSDMKRGTPHLGTNASKIVHSTTDESNVDKEKGTLKGHAMATDDAVQKCKAGNDIDVLRDRPLLAQEGITNVWQLMTGEKKAKSSNLATTDNNNNNGTANGADSVAVTQIDKDRTSRGYSFLAYAILSLISQCTDINNNNTNCTQYSSVQSPKKDVKKNNSIDDNNGDDTAMSYTSFEVSDVFSRVLMLFFSFPSSSVITSPSRHVPSHNVYDAKDHAESPQISQFMEGINTALHEAFEKYFPFPLSKLSGEHYNNNSNINNNSHQQTTALWSVKGETGTSATFIYVMIGTMLAKVQDKLIELQRTSSMRRDNNNTEIKNQDNNGEISPIKRNCSNIIEGLLQHKYASLWLPILLQVAQERSVCLLQYPISTAANGDGREGRSLGARAILANKISNKMKTSNISTVNDSNTENKDKNTVKCVSMFLPIASCCTFVRMSSVANATLVISYNRADTDTSTMNRDSKDRNWRVIHDNSNKGGEHGPISIFSLVVRAISTRTITDGEVIKLPGALLSSIASSSGATSPSMPSHPVSMATSTLSGGPLQPLDTPQSPSEVIGKFTAGLCSSSYLRDTLYRQLYTDYYNNHSDSKHSGGMGGAWGGGIGTGMNTLSIPPLKGLDYNIVSIIRDRVRKDIEVIGMLMTYPEKPNAVVEVNNNNNKSRSTKVGNAQEECAISNEKDKGVAVVQNRSRQCTALSVLRCTSGEVVRGRLYRYLHGEVESVRKATDIMQMLQRVSGNNVPK